MSAFDLWLLRFLLASCGCVVAGLGVWALTALCRRCVAEFSLQRSMWLLSQITVVATFLVILLPHSERLRVIPPIDLADETAARLVAAGGTTARAAASTAVSAPVAGSIERPWLAYGAQAWLLVYLLGLGYAGARLLHARRILNGLCAAGCRVDALNQHDGFAATLARAPAVIEVDAPISPMLFGLFRPRLLLPRHLRGFDVLQQQMIVEHELTHLRRRDLHWMSAGVLLQTLLWFNPFMRLLRAKLSWAQELGCDRDVLRGRPQAQRKAYAAALVAQLRMQRGPTPAALAFGGVGASTLAQRIALIRQPGTASRRPWGRCAALAGLAGIVGATLAFQPALAWRIDPVAAAGPALDKALWPFTPATPQGTISCTELVDAASGERLVHEGQCEQRVTPASTFNIPVSLMGYDSGILRDEHTPKLPYRAGYVNWNPSWRAATDPTSWLKNSVLWYAQQVTLQLGAARFQRYVKDFHYGNHDVAGDAGKDNGLTLSWVSSSLKISPVEQVAFLRNVVNRELPLTAKAYDMTLRIMQSDTLANGWEVHGKTGTASPVLPDGRDDEAHQYGWFVGWAKKDGRTIVFARLAQDPQRQTGAAGPRAKAAFLRDLPARLDAL
ncbi:bla regulator protein BlaR1 [Janthinobacterium sp. CG_S6]|nr:MULTISPECIES: class D beta-lactamase [unclassified Janthinobacterium]MEC5162465.1 bla regulator protein BlaR1 [Janthinobacterium sp. CG_S6]